MPSAKMKKRLSEMSENCFWNRKRLSNCQKKTDWPCQKK